MFRNHGGWCVDWTFGILHGGEITVIDVLQVQLVVNKNTKIVYIVIGYYVGDGTFICFKIMVVGV
jgi:hypothetical protein